MPLLSCNTLKNVADLTPDSPCDNVLLEYRLALFLAKIKGTAILPLFVGDADQNDDGDEVFNDYFRSACHPKFPDIIVGAIEKKAHQYTTEVQEALGLDPEEMEHLTVKQVIGEVMQFQGFSLRGLQSTALKDAVRSIHDCAQRIAWERESTKLVDRSSFYCSYRNKI